MSGTEKEQRRGRRERPPLNEEQLRGAALRYVGRFATTRHKLADFLRRKLRERGWAGASQPDVDGLVERIAELGYVDDAAFALAKANSLAGRGYGKRRVQQALQIAGVADDDRQAAHDAADARAAEAALKYARRKRIGPYATSHADPASREKALASMLRAGHSLTLAKPIVNAAPGEQLTEEELLLRMS